MPAKRQIFQIAIKDATKLKRKFHWGELVDGGLIDPKLKGQPLKVYACHEAQLDILKSKRKFTFAFAGSGGGKTCLIPLWLYKQVCKKPNGRFLVVSPTVGTFKRSQLKSHILNTFANTVFQGEWKEGDKTYQLPNGGEIIVITVGNGSEAERLKGGQYDAVVADECYELSEEVWEEIRRRGNNENAPILAVTTPDANNWIYEIKQLAEKGDPDYYVRHWATSANPTSSAVNLDRERKLLGEARFERMYGGKFVTLEGLIYDGFCNDNDANSPILHGNPYEIGLPSPPVRFFGGIDWGYYPDPFAGLLAAECENGIIYIVQELYGTRIPLDLLAAKLRGMVDRWAVSAGYAEQVTGGQFTCFWGDASRPEVKDLMKSFGIPVRTKIVHDIGAGIFSTASWFNSGRLKVFSCCENLVRELRGYQWSKGKGGDFNDAPIGKNDHTCDSLRYMISSQKYRIQPIPLAKEEVTEANELEKIKRLGVLLDPEAAKEAEIIAQKELFSKMAFGDDDSDDPFGIWNIH